MDRYHVYSSEDMVNWLDEGEILRSEDVTWGRPEGGFMWAPDCAYKNGTYYFYYPHPSGSDWNNSWKIGVATSKQPGTGFMDQGYIPGLGAFAMIDPCVFVDDDNRAYMYYGGGGRCVAGELNEDMMSIKGEMHDMNTLEDFHEATWVFKRNGVYYLTYSDNVHDNNQMRYATSDNPLGPWTYQGVFLETTGCSTSHGSVAEFKGKWYLFYHNQEISNQGNLRSMCIDELHFNEDGSIRIVTQTVRGLAPAGTLAETTEYPLYRVSEAGGGAGISLDDAGNKVAANLTAPEAYCVFTGIDGASGGRAALYIDYATSQELGKLHLFVNGEDSSLINATGTDNDSEYNGCVHITVRLNPGSDNTIKLTGGYGEIRVKGITAVSFGN
ncbi:family 43 glycosylhydrolase [Paenibacillus sp. GCM10012307]|uniref:Family 43 glycosylhydrolase n=1 Tax=Paenibacillus roseus TaxID=2798579 RepID=A0A934J5J7_9BACL|nr:family 43 glycosylhydrolase [Paenibacillus roseus]MBJ6360733.1 family 43 glycosylhydrolase [Paenibacillus roseus]